MKQASWAFRKRARRTRGMLDPRAEGRSGGPRTFRDWVHPLPWKPGHSPLGTIPITRHLFDHGRLARLRVLKQLGIWM